MVSLPSTLSSAQGSLPTRPSHSTQIKPRSLISTHDERKTARGIVAWLLKRKPLGGLDPASPAPEGDAVEPEEERALRVQKQLDQARADTTAYALAVGQHVDL